MKWAWLLISSVNKKGVLTLTVYTLSDVAVRQVHHRRAQRHPQSQTRWIFGLRDHAHPLCDRGCKGERSFSHSLPFGLSSQVSSEQLGSQLSSSLTKRMTFRIHPCWGFFNVQIKRYFCALIKSKQGKRIPVILAAKSCFSWSTAFDTFILVVFANKKICEESF